MSNTLEPLRTYWAYQGSAYEAPLYVFNNQDQAIYHADKHGEMEHTFGKEGWCDWVDRNVHEYTEDELVEEANIKFISTEAA